MELSEENALLKERIAALEKMLADQLDAILALEEKLRVEQQKRRK